MGVASGLGEPPPVCSGDDDRPMHRADKREDRTPFGLFVFPPHTNSLTARTQSRARGASEAIDLQRAAAQTSGD